MANSGEVQGQQVSKKPTDSAQFNMANFTYQGPAGTLYAAAAVVQTPGGVVTLIWASPNAVAIGVSAGNTPTVLSGATLPMTPGTGAYAPQPGIVDGVVVIPVRDPQVPSFYWRRVQDVLLEAAASLSEFQGHIGQIY